MCASRVNRAARDPCRSATSSTFTATSRLSTLSVATYTVPMPPRPAMPVMVYRSSSSGQAAASRSRSMARSEIQPPAPPSRVPAEQFGRLGLELFIARRQLTQVLEHDRAKLPAHRGQVVGDGCRRHSQLSCDVGVGRPLALIIGKVVSREHLEHRQPAGVTRMTLQVRDRSLQQTPHPFPIERLVGIGANRRFMAPDLTLRGLKIERHHRHAPAALQAPLGLSGV